MTIKRHAMRFLTSVALGIAVISPAFSDAVAAEFKVVLDAGHGGRDGGALGRKGTREKDVTLRFALKVREKLAHEPSVTVLMTREDDVEVKLDDRVAFGRENAADLFISIHADSIRHKRVRGASIYTLAEEASDEVAQELADSQARSDLLAGFVDDGPEEPAVSDILVDLMRRETEAFSHVFATGTIGQLSAHTRMIRNPHRHGDFRVLRAPDVPSVLIELGYLSNRQDEAMLRDKKWQDRIADVLADAIIAHAQTMTTPESAAKTD